MRLWSAAGARPVLRQSHVSSLLQPTLRPGPRPGSCPGSCPALASPHSFRRSKSSGFRPKRDSSVAPGEAPVDKAINAIIARLQGRPSPLPSPPQRGESNATTFPNPRHAVKDGQTSSQASAGDPKPDESGDDQSKHNASNAPVIREAKHPLPASRDIQESGNAPASDAPHRQDAKPQRQPKKSKPNGRSSDEASVEAASVASGSEQDHHAQPEQAVQYADNPPNVQAILDRAAQIKASGPTARRRRARLRRAAGRLLSRPADTTTTLTARVKGRPVKKNVPIRVVRSRVKKLLDPAIAVNNESATAGKPRSLKDALSGTLLEDSLSMKRMTATGPATIRARDVQLTPVPVDQPPVPRLYHGLDKVLFNQGVYNLQDPHSMVYNFDPYLQKIMPVADFDYNALGEYKTSSRDKLLESVAKERNIKYIGSTSSMTATLTHFHHLLSNWRHLNFSMLSRTFPEESISRTFTELNRAPTAIFLRWKSGTYAIDADKEFDSGNVLMLLGRSLEKLLTMPISDFEKYRKSDPRNVSEAQRKAPDSFHFSTQGDFLMRSQLDAYDPRLPGTGMFDLKTRAVVTVRMQASDYEEMSGYELCKQQGLFESYEREFYDMVRSTMLKYSLQARMGRMDGIFLAYHNVKRIFGFQYLSIGDMDRPLHGQTGRCLGDQEFALSIDLLNKALNKATERFPGQSIRFHFEARPGVLPFMYIFAEPMSDDDIDRIQNSQKEKIAEFERSIMGHNQQETGLENPGDKDNTVTSQAPDTVESASPTDYPPLTQEDDTYSQIPSAEDNKAQTSGEATKSTLKDSAFTSNDPEAQNPKAEPAVQQLRPLLAINLAARSRVNGQFVVRPTKLEASDEWEVEYSMTEITDPARAWALYEATKARRKRCFDRLGRSKEGEKENDDPEAKAVKSNDAYIEMMRRLSQKGREKRSLMDLAELDRDKVVYGQPFGKVASSAPSFSLSEDEVAAVQTDGVKGYLRWLYSTGIDAM